jgi:hypothetical protein
MFLVRYELDFYILFKINSVFKGLSDSGCEADHSLPSSAEVKNGGAIPPHPHTFAWRYYVQGQLK